VLALIRAEGKVFPSGTSLTPEVFLQTSTLQRASKSEATRRVEIDFDLGDCLYFFAGHACSEFGDVVLVYDEAMADSDTGSATPFDTGGLHANHIHYDPTSGANRPSYCRSHMRTLGEWRRHAREYIEEHFESTEAYILGDKPIKDDKTMRLLNPSNSRRAWTWEVRIHRDHPLEESLLGVWMAEDYYDRVRQDVIATRAGSDWAKKRKVHPVYLPDTPHEIAEREVSKWP
jgi:hypothetical protein